MDASINSDLNTPKLITTDIFGNKVNLSKQTDDYTLLVFLRYSGCPWCNLAIHRLTMEYARLHAEGCGVIAIVQSNKEDILDNIYARHDPTPQFAIIADHEMNFYKRFDVNPSIIGTFSSISDIPYWLQSVRKLGFKQKKLDGNFFMVPAWFLINNKSGKIVKKDKGNSFYNDATFTPIYESLIFKE